ncbi:MAG TPA: hypothetical protein VIV09_12450 [Pseudolabrys sp.]
MVQAMGNGVEKRRTTLSMSEAAIFLGVGWTQIKGVLRRHRIARHGIPVERLFRILELRQEREARRRGQ